MLIILCVKHIVGTRCSLLSTTIGTTTELAELVDLQNTRIIVRVWYSIRFCSWASFITCEYMNIREVLIRIDYIQQVGTSRDSDIW